MNKHLNKTLNCSKILTFFCFVFISTTAFAQTLKSPDQNLTANFSLADGGIATYSLKYRGKDVIKTSKLGLELKEGK